MPPQLDRKQRIHILFEAYLAFKGEATVAEFYKWLAENKLTNSHIYTSREIGMILSSSGKFEKNKNKWRRRGR